MVDVSIVIPIRNAAGTLPGCFEALERLDPKPAEIILVENGSCDSSPTIVRSFAEGHTSSPVHIVSEPRRGASTARNRGIQEAKGALVAFTDADCRVDSAWLTHLLKPFSDPEVGAVAGKIVAAAPHSSVEHFSALFTLLSPQTPSFHTRWSPWEGGFPTANLVVRRSLLQVLQGFHEDVQIYGEDYDLCARLYKIGARIAYTPEACVTHHHRTTVSGLLQQAFGFGRSHPYLLHRHTTGGLWLEVPTKSFFNSGWPIPTWIDLASADKKLMGLLLLAFLFPPMTPGLFLYGIWLSVVIHRRARAMGMPVPGPRSIILAGLLVAKSFAMTLGRWWGSVKYHAVCL